MSIKDYWTSSASDGFVFKVFIFRTRHKVALVHLLYVFSIFQNMIVQNIYI